jgi:hydroxymethylpyrimidine/phosphomethylpyrimidine kinase
MTVEDIQPFAVLTIGGSDSGGAAGIQADLKTLTALKTYGMSVITAVTAQNSVNVEAIQPLSAEFVAAQLEAVMSDYRVDAVKTGFIGRVDLIVSIAAKLRDHKLKKIVVDPVLVDHRHRPMFSTDVARAYATHLLPVADVVTPTGYEAALLADIPRPKPATLAWHEKVARSLHALGPQHVLIKTGRFGADSVDILYDGQQFTRFSSPWINTDNTHGSGDTLSAALCAFLAKGNGMETAVQRANQFTANAIRGGANWKLGQGHGPLAHFPLE